MRKILKYLKPYAFKIAAGTTIKFLGTIMDLLLPYILAYTIDSVIPKESVSLIVIWGTAMILCAFVAVIANIIANRMASKVARDSIEEIRHDLFERITLLSCKQVDELTIPSLESRLTTDTYHLHQMIGMMQRLGIRAPILLIGGMIVTLTLEPLLALILLICIPIIGAVVFFISRKGIPLYKDLQKSVDRLVLTMRENITGIRVIKALSKVDYEKERFEQVNTEVVKKEKKAGITMASSNPIMNLLLNIGLTLVIITGAFLVNSGAMLPGKILAFLNYFTIILNAMLSITRMFVMFSRGSASADRISAILDTPYDLEVEEEKEKKFEDYHIAFDNVSFSYLKKKNNINDLSFYIKKGETLGIIGETGCGKSTVIRLLMRLYDPDEGNIYINGQNIKSIEKDKLHTKFGVVFQNDFLFADTIYENIDFGRHFSEEEIKRACVDAQASEFIDSLEDGLSHRLATKASNLSGGQKQRLLLARALLSKSEILILDDSSSALDYKTDALLRNALKNNFKDSTKIVIAQRISSIMNADKILVLENGEPIGYGTHDELIKSCDIYKQISLSQLGGEDIA